MGKRPSLNLFSSCHVVTEKGPVGVVKVVVDGDLDELIRQLGGHRANIDSMCRNSLRNNTYQTWLERFLG